MTKTVACTALAALTLSTLSSSAAHAERPRIAVMELSAPKVAPDLRQRATRAVQEGLLASGADVVEGMPAAATGPGGAPCDGSGCITAVAKASVANYVVRGTLEIEGRTYGLRLEILDGKSGDLVESREDRCEICTEGEALEMAGVSASALKVQAFKKGAAPAPDVTAPAVVTPPPAPLIATAATTPSLGQRRLGWVGVGVGAAAVAAGTVLFALDGQGDCGGPDTCMNRYKTGRLGLVSFMGGTALVIGGFLMMAGKF
ncbi:MAG: hypothetical protein JWM82_1469 [Myxococcales bacterium]|nr:hypothetical protein [Myxococcales bacterium]